MIHKPQIEIFPFKIQSHTRSVFWLVKQGYSFKGFKGLIEMQERNQANIGKFCRSDTSAKAMAKSISTVYLEELKLSLELADSPLSLIIDGVLLILTI